MFTLPLISSSRSFRTSHQRLAIPCTELYLRSRMTASEARTTLLSRTTFMPPRIALPDHDRIRLECQNTREDRPIGIVLFAPNRIGCRPYNCETFKRMQPDERVNVVRQCQLGFNCLLPGHCSNACRKQSVCSVPGCGRKHTKFLHVYHDKLIRSRKLRIIAMIMIVTS